MRSRAKTTWKLTVSVVALVLLALGGVVALCFQEPTGPKQVLSDGTVLELVGVTCGPEHELVLGNWWQRTGGKFLQDHFPALQPSPPNAYLGFGINLFGPTILENRATWSTPQREPLLWFRLRAPNTREGRNNPYVWQIRSRTRDHHGCLLACVEGAQQPLVIAGSFPGHPTDLLAAATVPIYPRRESTFEYGLYAQESDKPLARFTIATPAPEGIATWVASPPPIHATVDGVDCTLTRLRYQRSAESQIDGFASFRCTEAALPARHWSVDSMTLNDSTGNRQLPRQQGAMEEVPFRGLCRRESAWKLSLQLMHDNPYEAAPDYTVTFRDLPVPIRNRVLPSARVTRVGGMEIRVTGIQGTGKIQTEGSTTIARIPEVQCSIQSNSDLLVAALAIVDERGHNWITKRNHQINRLSKDWSSGVSFSVPNFPAGSRCFSLTLGLSLARKVEMLVKPEGG